MEIQNQSKGGLSTSHPSHLHSHKHKQTSVLSNITFNFFRFWQKNLNFEIFFKKESCCQQKITQNFINFINTWFSSAGTLLMNIIIISLCLTESSNQNIENFPPVIDPFLDIYFTPHFFNEQKDLIENILDFQLILKLKTNDKVSS